MLKWTRSLFATKRSVGCAVDGTNNVSWGLILPKTTRAMDVLPERREPIKTILGARSARSLSPSEGVAGPRSRLAYMFLRARGGGWPLCGAAGFSGGAHAATARDLQRLRNRQWAAKGVSTLTAALVRLRRRFYGCACLCFLVSYYTLAVICADEANGTKTSLQLAPKL